MDAIDWSGLGGEGRGLLINTSLSYSLGLETIK